MLYVALFFVAAAGRVTSDVFDYNFAYPALLQVLFDQNRVLYTGLISFLTIYSVLFNGVSGLSPSVNVWPILLHTFLAIKLLLVGNPEWITSSAGVLSIFACTLIFRNLSGELLGGNCLAILLEVLTATFLVIAAYQYWDVGADNMTLHGRFFFFSIHPNHAGIMWAFCALGMLHLVLSSQRWSIRKLALMCSSLFCLYLTGSRGSLISFAVGALALLYLHPAKGKYRLAAVALIALAILMSVGAGDAVLNSYVEQVERGDTRRDVFTLALSDFLDNPLFGAEYLTGRPRFVENVALSFLMSAGTIGVALMIGFYFTSVRLLRRAVIECRRHNDVSGRLFAAVMAMMLVASIFEAYQLTFVTFGCLIWILSSVYLDRFSEAHR